MFFLKNPILELVTLVLDGPVLPVGHTSHAFWRQTPKPLHLGNLDAWFHLGLENALLPDDKETTLDDWLYWPTALYKPLASILLQCATYGVPLLPSVLPMVVGLTPKEEEEEEHPLLQMMNLMQWPFEDLPKIMNQPVEAALAGADVPKDQPVSDGEDVPKDKPPPPPANRPLCLGKLMWEGACKVSYAGLLALLKCMHESEELNYTLESWDFGLEGFGAVYTQWNELPPDHKGRRTGDQIRQKYDFLTYVKTEFQAKMANYRDDQGLLAKLRNWLTSGLSAQEPFVENTMGIDLHFRHFASFNAMVAYNTDLKEKVAYLGIDVPSLNLASPLAMEKGQEQHRGSGILMVYNLIIPDFFQRQGLGTAIIHLLEQTLARLSHVFGFMVINHVHAQMARLLQKRYDNVKLDAKQHEELANKKHKANFLYYFPPSLDNAGRRAQRYGSHIAWATPETLYEQGIMAVFKKKYYEVHDKWVKFVLDDALLVPYTNMAHHFAQSMLPEHAKVGILYTYPKLGVSSSLGYTMHFKQLVNGKLMLVLDKIKASSTGKDPIYLIKWFEFVIRLCRVWDRPLQVSEPLMAQLCPHQPFSEQMKTWWKLYADPAEKPWPCFSPNGQWIPKARPSEFTLPAHLQEGFETFEWWQQAMAKPEKFGKELVRHSLPEFDHENGPWIKLITRLDQDLAGTELTEIMPRRAYDYLRRTNLSLEFNGSMGKHYAAAFNDLEHTVFDVAEVEDISQWYSLSRFDQDEWRRVLKDDYRVDIDHVLA